LIDDVWMKGRVMIAIVAVSQDTFAKEWPGYFAFKVGTRDVPA
jgi:hypothetical protein